MSESPYHTKMVREMDVWLKQKYPDMNMSIFLDIPGIPSQQLPKIINSQRPDLFARHPTNGFICLGEAETATSLETPHSRRQIQTFLKYLSDKEESLFILATSWDRGACAKSLLSALQAEISAENVKIKIITVWP